MRWRTLGTYGIQSDVPVAGGRVYYGAVNLICLDAAHGAVIWTNTNPDSTESSPSVADGVVYVGMAHGMSAFDAGYRGRALLLHHRVGGGESPTIVNGSVYFGSYDDNLYALDLPSGVTSNARPLTSQLHPNTRLHVKPGGQ